MTSCMLNPIILRPVIFVCKRIIGDMPFSINTVMEKSDLNSNKTKNNGGNRGVVSLAIIPDGNRRWAKKRLLPAESGHYEGAQNFRRIIRSCADRGIGYLTFYAFSTENWKRSEKEVAALMKIFSDLMESFISKPDDGGRNVRLRVIGDRSGLSENLLKDIEKIESVTAGRKGMTVNICISYGSRDEITMSVRDICRKCKDGLLDPEKVNEKTIGGGLFAPDTPDPDLIIRTSGELRLSNFLLWQAAYSELYFTDCFWPDFNDKELDAALDEFARRKRRFGA